MAKLRREIKEMKTSRDTKRSGRRSNGVPSVAIAGYTNAGKSSLLNRLTGAGVLVENQLFATLDPTVRRAETADGRVYTLADTVGFRPAAADPAGRGVPFDAGGGGRGRPAAARRRRLAPRPRGQISAVRGVLADVDAADVKEVIVVNKADAADPEVLDRLRRHEKHCLIVSARTGLGIDALRDLIADELPRPRIDVDVLLPYDRGDLVTGSTRRLRSSRASTPRPVPAAGESPRGPRQRARGIRGLSVPPCPVPGASPSRARRGCWAPRSPGGWPNGVEPGAAGARPVEGHPA